jgi:hypothetical protein
MERRSFYQQYNLRRPQLGPSQAKQFLRLEDPTMLRLRIKSRLKKKLQRPPSDDEVNDYYKKVKQKLGPNQLYNSPPDVLYETMVSAGYLDLAESFMNAVIVVGVYTPGSFVLFRSASGSKYRGSVVGGGGGRILVKVTHKQLGNRWVPVSKPQQVIVPEARIFMIEGMARLSA